METYLALLVPSLVMVPLLRVCSLALVQSQVILKATALSTPTSGTRMAKPSLVLILLLTPLHQQVQVLTRLLSPTLTDKASPQQLIQLI